MQQNHMRSLPEWIGRFRTLRELDFSINRFRRFPEYGADAVCAVRITASGPDLAKNALPFVQVLREGPSTALSMSGEKESG